MRQRIRTALISMSVVVTAVVGTGLAPGAPATAAAPGTETLSGFTAEPADATAQSVQLRNLATHRCLEQAYGGATGHVFTAPCHGGTSQTWTWIGGGDFKSLRNLWSQECLDGTSATGRVYTLSCNNGGYQWWKMYANGQIGQYQSGHKLDSNWEGSVYLSPGNTGDYQKWF
ncbi:ricin-type beta-trefoil lectin domain protein [Nonomuraea sp. PA05]|uniref:RICIN domain-containing protein n=1 Tax=Nonomuraea sp. PA05 TaxID=2604466 RepID=UPI0011D31D22|nr:ricin-type beta-trefoil lectin domain protein [Nonomuraea sp. PA05]TYB57620.1 ricin-type beta-trefoil lectin domain protein [Nonomuraea sp. PA05]